MIEDLSGDWYSPEYKAKHDQFDLLLRNLRYMLYRYKDNIQIKDRVHLVIPLVERDLNLFMAENAAKIKERDMLFLGGLEQSKGSDS